MPTGLYNSLTFVIAVLHFYFILLEKIILNYEKYLSSKTSVNLPLLDMLQYRFKRKAY